MSDMLAKAQTWLAGVRQNSLATDHPLIYVRNGSGERITMTRLGVVIANSDERLDQSTAGSLDIEERDYIIPREIFERWPFLADNHEAPERTDVIEEVGDDLRTYSFRVVALGVDVAWEWHDRQRTAYRVHCQLIGIK